MAGTSARTAYGEGTSVALPVTGGCACGALRYAVDAGPVIGLHCHCRKCQHLSGTGHGSHLVLRRAAATVSGEVGEWQYRADSGGTTHKFFCPACGTQVYAMLSRHPEGIVVAASSLDDRRLFQPTVALFTGEAASWDAPAPDLDHYPAGL